MITMYSLLFSVNKSAASFSHGLFCTAWGSRLSACCFGLYVRHEWQSCTLFDMSVFILGQYKTSLARRLHFSMPKCPSCIFLSIKLLIVAGTTILLPFRIRPSASDSSLRTFQYSLTGTGYCCVVSGHSSRMTLNNSCSALSFFVSSTNWLRLCDVTAIFCITVST